MLHRTVSPAFVVPGESVRILDRRPRVHTTFDERFLQDLLADHPELLPVGHLRDDVGSPLCIGWDVAISSGTIDNLYLSTQGYSVIVETKLWRNPQARREVLSQTLDHVKNVTRTDYGTVTPRIVWNPIRTTHGARVVRARRRALDATLCARVAVRQVRCAESTGSVISTVRTGEDTMTRLGREPTEDVKRRLVAACHEVGLTVSQARMFLAPDSRARVVYVGASPAGWDKADPVLSIMARISVAGAWSETVQIGCSAAEAGETNLQRPVMRGRDRVPLGDLVTELIRTLEERDQVIAGSNAGQTEPFHFERTVWKRPNPFESVDPS